MWKCLPQGLSCAGPFYLEGDPVPPKLFLAPAKDGGAPPDADGTGGAAAPSAASPSALAGGRRMSAGKSSAPVLAGRDSIRVQ